MSFIFSKHFKIFYIFFLLITLENCQLKDTKKSHGINFLPNREKVLLLNKTNKNDVIKIIGNPHSVSIKDNDTWIYFERSTGKGKLYKLGQNVLKSNNILELKFDSYGILQNKQLYTKEDMNKVKRSKKFTKNEISQKGFVEKFLSSIRQKMYGKNKF